MSQNALWYPLTVQTLDQRHIVTLQQNLTQLSPALFLVLRSLLHLHSIINHQVHEFVKTPDSSLNSDRQLLVKPYLNRRVLLKELEDEVNWWEQDFASTSSAASVHFE